MSARPPGAVPPRARDLVTAVAGAPTTCRKTLVIGGVGTGKTATLAAIRAAMRTAGVEVITQPPPAAGRAGGAVVIDDAHLLTDSELDALTALVADPATTLVVSAEPRQHQRALRALIVTMERENPAVVLGALAAGEVRHAVDAARHATPATTVAADSAAEADVARALMAATAGLPFLVSAALGAVHGADPSTAMTQAARFALIERLRGVDEETLDALLIGSLSPDLGPTDLSAALRITIDEAQTIVDRARSSGLIEPSHNAGFLRSVHRAVAQIVGAARHHEVETCLLTTQLELQTLTADLAVRLGEHGLRDDRLAGRLMDQADHVADQPALAARLYRAAVGAGAARRNARLADALALTGDCAAAGRLADDLLTSSDTDERAAAARIAASVAAHDGNAGQAAELFRWLGPHPDAFVGAAGAVALLGAGDADAARAALDATGSGPPTTVTRAARSLAEGLLLTLDRPFDVAMARLGQALSNQATACAVPDTPAALVTLASLHGGDSVRARNVIGRAARTGGAEAFTHRHTLLSAWVKMLDGQLGPAAGEVAALRDTDLHRRDALWAAALRTGLARRGGDGGGLQRHWFVAMDVLSEYSIDLFSLLPLGELWVAGARLRQADRLRHTLDEAFALLDRLGRPALWSVPLHWAGVHAGILANSPGALAPHGQALSAAAATDPFAKALAAAGRAWLRVLANQVDTGEVTAAVRGLAAFGHTWDATRLASQAALQTPDPRVSGAMLQLARDLKATMSADEDPADAQDPTSKASARVPQGSPAARLSEREREVADLLLVGMPYRDIGAQLFISAKTVEHHVARIRRRLGAESRSELLTMLRAMLAPQT